MYDKQYGSVSPDYLACIIALLSMLSLIMNKHDMSNNPTHYVIDILQQVVFTIVLELIRSGTCTSFRIRPNIRGFTSHQAPHNANAHKAARTRWNRVHRHACYNIIGTDKLDDFKRVNNSLIFISIIVRYLNYLIKSGKGKAPGKDISILFMCV